MLNNRVRILSRYILELRFVGSDIRAFGERWALPIPTAFLLQHYVIRARLAYANPTSIVRMHVMCGEMPTTRAGLTKILPFAALTIANPTSTVRIHPSYKCWLGGRCPRLGAGLTNFSIWVRDLRRAHKNNNNRNTKDKQQTSKQLN